MREPNFTILAGAPWCGKTTLMLELAGKIRRESGMRLAFVGWTPEFSDEKANPDQAHIIQGIRDNFEFARFLAASEDENSKMLQLLSELARRGDFDLLFVDDIFSHFPAADNARGYASAMLDMPLPKIATYTLYEDEVGFLGRSLPGSHTFLVEPDRTVWPQGLPLVDGRSAEEFMATVSRDIKLKKIME